MKKILIFFNCIIVLLLSCKEKKTNSDFELKNFIPITNYGGSLDSIKVIALDYEDAIDSGFIIPSKNQTSNGYFNFEFELKNNSNEAKEYFYKIYYQNESYKFLEHDKDSVNKENELATENFYGSWDNAHKTFYSTGIINNDNVFYKIKDSIRIVGNPREELRYYGVDAKDYSERKIKNETIRITNDTKWVASIKEKAKKNKMDFESQLKLDVLYLIESEADATINNRWKRNPRVGNYSFLLVVVEKSVLVEQIIPENIQDICQVENERYVNPYFYYLYGEGKNLERTNITLINNALKVYAKPDLGSGIFIDKRKIFGKDVNTNFYNSNCGEDYILYKKAAFQQFFHDLNPEDKLHNIPLVENIFENNYSIEEYLKNSEEFKENELITTDLKVTDCPCKTVVSDTIRKKITIRNPGTIEGEWRKENVGVKSRHGFTYGKFRMKVKLTHLTNKQNVWNGITNAIWMIYQNEAWNNRRNCNNAGYIPKDQSGEKAERKKTLDYSEIDFEIVKTSRDWPKSSYTKSGSIKPFNNDKDEDIMVTCTNWDMACREPINFNIGAKRINYNDTSFIVHRWDDWYKAITIKTPANENELFGGEYYYFEIEWQPTEIIWRIGSELNKMKVVGYMNSDFTSIPNNQMLMVVTQEYHLGEWWPMAEFKQDKIPFPKDDYIGEIFEFTIE